MRVFTAWGHYSWILSIIVCKIKLRLVFYHLMTAYRPNMSLMCVYLLPGDPFGHLF